MAKPPNKSTGKQNKSTRRQSKSIGKRRAPTAHKAGAPSDLRGKAAAVAATGASAAKRDRKTATVQTGRVPTERTRTEPVLTDRAQPERAQPERVPADHAVPGARISRRAADRLRSGHVWVYASDIEALETNVHAGQIDTPSLLPVADNRGLLMGTALYSPSSQIALRMVSREAIGEKEWLGLLEARLRRSIERRITLLKSPEADTDSCRLVFSEADELPGLVADKYRNLVVLQLLAKGLDSAAVRSTCVRVIRELVSPAAIVERPDPRVRELEGLSAPSSAPLWALDPESPQTSTVFHLNGLRFHYDANAGQKTGAFLDQRVNYAAAKRWASLLTPGGRALDVCTYQGGFALHLAETCREVIGIDASRASLQVAERNLEANRDRLTAAVEWVEADAFELLRDWSDAKQVFDTIVLDPPAFAKSHRAVEGALRGYKELNLRALKMIRPGGLLVTCSCSHHVGWADLEGAVASAAADAHRRVRILERRGAALDHPVVLNLPESEYLKCLVLEVD
jgi:23S rRNA (cytosine1962-C5)-methyltransferase